MTESVQGTSLTTATGSITDASGNVWTLQNVSDGYYLIAENGTVVPVSGNPSLTIAADTVIVVAPSNFTQTAHDTQSISLSWSPATQGAGAPIIIFVDGSVSAASSFAGGGKIQNFAHGVALQSDGASATQSVFALKSVAAAKQEDLAQSTSAITFSVVGTALGIASCRASNTFLSIQAVASISLSTAARSTNSFINLTAAGTTSQFTSATGNSSFFALAGSAISNIFLLAQGSGTLGPLALVAQAGADYPVRARQNIDFKGFGSCLADYFVGLARIFDLIATGIATNVTGMVARNRIDFNGVGTANSFPLLVGRSNINFKGLAILIQENPVTATQTILSLLLDVRIKQSNITTAVNTVFSLTAVGVANRQTAFASAKQKVLVLTATGQAGISNPAQGRSLFFVINIAHAVSVPIATEDGFLIAADSTNLIITTDLGQQVSGQINPVYGTGTIVLSTVISAGQYDQMTGTNHIDLNVVSTAGSSTEARGRGNIVFSIFSEVGSIAIGLANIFNLSLKSLEQPFLLDDTFSLLLCADPVFPVVLLKADNILLVHAIQEDLASVTQDVLSLASVANAFASNIAQTTQNINITNVATADQFDLATATSSIDFTGTGIAFQVGQMIGLVQLDWTATGNLTSSTNATAVQNVDFAGNGVSFLNLFSTALGSIDLTVSATASIGHVASAVNNVDYTGTGQADQFNEASSIVSINLTSIITVEQDTKATSTNDVLQLTSVSQVDQVNAADAISSLMDLAAAGTLVINTATVSGVGTIELTVSGAVNQYNPVTSTTQIFSITTQGGHLWKAPLEHFESQTVVWWSD